MKQNRKNSDAVTVKWRAGCTGVAARVQVVVQRRRVPPQTRPHAGVHRLRCDRDDAQRLQNVHQGRGSTRRDPDLKSLPLNRLLDAPQHRRVDLRAGRTLGILRPRQLHLCWMLCWKTHQKRRKSGLFNLFSFKGPPS